MPSVYPGALDTLSNPSGTDDLGDHEDQHVALNDGIEAVEVTLGIDPQGDYDDVDERLSWMETVIAANP